jgi:S-adenosyl-L-methionine hydrolase (adenosine-forming)
VSAPLITFLSDYGYADEFVGVCHGVIAGRCPQARVIDITHAIPAGDVRTGALVLADALAFMPAGVHLAVVDPGVGAGAESQLGQPARAAVAVSCLDAPQRLLVGPDNGLLALALERFGGALDAVEISRSRERLHPLSRTFHGRDIFAPVAAALAGGAGLQDVGEPISLAALVALELPKAEYRDGGLAAHVLRCDHFGNVVLDATPAEVEVMTGEHEADVWLLVGLVSHRARTADAFADVPPGELLLYEDANGAVAIAANGASAAELLNVHAGAEIVVRPQ